jgi:flagellin
MPVINTNVKSSLASDALRINERALSGAMQQLSTGKRINSAKDDAAGLAISTRMTADLRGMSMAMKNANDGISMMQTAEAALGEITNMLQRMRELAVQAATGSMSTANRKQLQAEFDQLAAEIDNVSKTTNFNNIKLLDGSAKGVAIQTGTKQGDQVKVDINSASTKALGIQGYAIRGSVQSGRVGEMSDVAFDDIMINGRAWAKADYDSAADAPTANQASGLASIVNDNTGSTGVRATAYNIVRGFLPTVSSFADGDLNINGIDVRAAGNVEELVSNINRDVAGITAVLEKDGTINLSNNTGDDIIIAGNAPLTAGFNDAGGLAGDGTYTGYVALESVTGDDVAIVVRNPTNGYTSGGGTLDDLARLGFNEIKADGSVTGQQVMWFNGSSNTDKFGALTLDDSVKINGISLGTTSDGSAAAKVAAINALSEQTGVKASAFTEVVARLDLTQTMADYNGTTETFSINGTVINLSDIDGNGTDAANLHDVVKAIEFYGPQGVKATATERGELKLTSDTGQNVTVKDTSGALVLSFDDSAAPSVGTRTLAAEEGFDNTWNATWGDDTDSTDGFTYTNDADFTDGVTFGGRINLSSSVGAEINLKGDYISLRKLGLNEMGGSSSSLGGALTILTQESAGHAITKLDVAIDTVSTERATLGAFQNRLTAAVDNLASSSTNLTEARSRILDTDYASATTELARAQIIQQAATAMLAQANQAPQQVLSLLK